MMVLEVVELWWVDSECPDRWAEMDEITDNLTLMPAVGLLIHQDKDFYALAIAYDPNNDSALSVVKFPRGQVKKVKTIKAIKVK